MNLKDIAKTLSVPVALLQTGARRVELRVVQGGKVDKQKKEG